MTEALQGDGKRATRGDIDAYRDELRALTNAELVDRIGSLVLGAAILSSRMRGWDGWEDDCLDACSDEARARGNEDLYQRGFNNAVRSQGHTQLVAKVTTPLNVGEPRHGR